MPRHCPDCNGFVPEHPAPGYLCRRCGHPIYDESQPPTLAERTEYRRECREQEEA